MHRVLVAGALAAFLVPAIPAPAIACGGFFCGQQPVEQNAERILFEIGENTVSAVVEITYSGSPDDFSWILPLSGDLVGELEIVPSGVLTLLELATLPQIVPPESKCSTLSAPNSSLVRGSIIDVEQGGVDVTELDRVGPFEPVLVTADDPVALVTWLNDNGYTVTPAMQPVIDDYVAENFSFLAMQLAPDAGTQDIAPVQITYSGTEPMIPLMLTSVATEPEMAIIAFVAANTRYEASNYANLEVSTDDLHADPINGQNNYYPLVSWMIDNEGGRAFVTEFAGTTTETFTNIQNVFLNSDDAEESTAWLQALMTRKTTMTRMFARMGGWEMTADPSFQPSAGGAVSRTLDLSDQPAVEVCGPANSNRIVACGSTYCGVGAQCATTADGVDGCVCAEGHTARTILAPNAPGGVPIMTVTCQEASFDFLGDVVGTANGPSDPCFANVCGENGTCVQVNGFATCDCSDGFAAIPNGVGGTRCVEALDTYEPEQLLWPTGCSGSSCAQVSNSTPAFFAFIFAFLAVPRRRRTA